MAVIHLGFLLLVFTLVYGKPSGPRADTCAGYQACHPVDDNKINVHIIPHSHDDVGWLKTVDQYYYQNVQSIISSVIPALLENPDRRFVQVETAYFYMWWRDQPDNIKKDTIKLINEGRLEIIGGAWSMNDEAASHYQSTIDQFTYGLRFIEDTLGKCARPKSGWQIDPFGHSREQASIFAQMGYDSVYFARLDYRDRDKRKKEKRMEMLWQGSANLGNNSNIFTHAFKSHYSAPGGFCFDIRCGDAPIVINEDSPEYNWDKRVNEFAEKVVKDYIQYYDNNQILITWGDDFKWEAALTSYINIDLLIQGFKKFNPKVNGKEVNIFYSTPTCYTKAINDHVIKNKKTLDHKTDDFFPYADGPNTVWSGYFTSRPTSKRFERTSNNLLQVSKQLKALSGTASDSTSKLEAAMGVMQHHDAITGTEKAAVEKDYHRMLSKARQAVVIEDSKAFSKLVGSSADLELKSCPLLNISVCDEADKDEFNIVLWNPLARTTSHYIQIPVRNGKWEVKDSDGKVIENHVSDNVQDFKFMADNLGKKYLEKTLFFRAENLPPLGYKTYHFKKTANEVDEPKTYSLDEIDQMGFTSNYVNFDKTTGLVKSITLRNVSIDVKQQLMYYESHEDVSGAYIFRSRDQAKNAKTFADKADSKVTVNDGELIREIKQTWKDYASQVVRIFKEDDFIEFDWIVGPIDISDKIGKEIISRFSTNLKTNGEFYTDSNGREMLKRKKDYRPTYPYTPDEPQSGNYYPVTSKISINDGTKQFSILNDRAEGGSSLNDGEIEVMVHRACTKDDKRGVGENLDEQEFGKGLIARGSFYVTVGDITKGDGKKTMTAVEREIAQRKLLAPWIFFTTKDVPTKSKSFLKKAFPENVHLLTLDKWDNNDKLLIRLEHILEENEDPNLSKPVTVDLTDAFTEFSVTSLKEYNLAANTPLEEVSRLSWPQIQDSLPDDSPLKLSVRSSRPEADLKITLAPMQIRTFIADIKRK